jgi:hypothetical protein
MFLLFKASLVFGLLFLLEKNALYTPHAHEKTVQNACVLLLQYCFVNDPSVIG